MARPVNYKRAVLLAFLIFITLAVVKATVSQGWQLSPLGSAARDITGPLQGVAMKVGQGVRGVFSFSLGLVKMSRQNQEYRKRIEELEGSLRIYQEYALENQRLVALQNFKSATANPLGFDTMTAAVVGRDPGNWFGTITINRGTLDGVAVNMTVITPAGLVGRIISVAKNTSEVLLITDPRSGVGALLQQTRAPGLLQGTVSTRGRLQMVHISSDIKVEEEQVVVTSGTGSLFLGGIPVGSVSKSGREPAGLFNSAEITPYVDFSRLEEVLVVRGTRQAEGDALSIVLPPWGQGRIPSGSPGSIRAGEEGAPAGQGDGIVEEPQGRNRSPATGAKKPGQGSSGNVIPQNQGPPAPANQDSGQPAAPGGSGGQGVPVTPDTGGRQTNPTHPENLPAEPGQGTIVPGTAG